VIIKVTRWVALIGLSAACQPFAAPDRGAQHMPTKTPGGPAARAAVRALVLPPAAPPAVDCAVAKCLALTFDDGPGPYTDRLLDILKARSVRATFFVVGRNAAEYPEVLRREVAEHHEIGNHTYDHADLVRLSDRGIRREISRTQKIVHRATGWWPTVMRPPYGATDERVNRVAGLPEIMWRGDTLDWLHRNSRRVRRSVLKLAEPNAIILLHDIRKTTVAAMPRTLNTLIERGYTMVTVSDLYRGTRLRPGHAYGWS
jgi:peptidoglycan/xylan/chitin deacetylase (PgdA/CDA1 family)